MKPILNPYPDEGQIGVFKVSVTYVQEADSNSKSEEEQYITFSTQDAPVPDDQFPYYLEIKTEKWCFDDEEEMKELIDDFINRVKGIEKK